MIMVASADERERELSWLSSRPKSMARNQQTAEGSASSSSETKKPFLAALTENEFKFYMDYFKVVPKPGKPRVTTGWAVSTNQSVLRGFGSTSDGTSYLQTVIKNTGVMIWNERSITPEELLMYQLFPLRCFGRFTITRQVKI